MPATTVLCGPVQGKKIEPVVADRPDRCGRVSAQRYAGDMGVYDATARRGGAWFNSEHARADSLHWVEPQARDAKTGLSALPVTQRIGIPV